MKNHSDRNLAVKYVKSSLTETELQELTNDSWGRYHYEIMRTNFRYLTAEQMKRIYLITQEPFVL